MQLKSVREMRSFPHQEEGGQEREVFERENAWETNNADAFLSVERSGCRRVRICSQAVALVPF